jgi:hypothetical protein
MTGLPEVFAGVLVRAGIAASDMPTSQAHAQVCPGVDAVLFAGLAMSRRARIGLGGISGGIEVFTRIGDRGGLRIGLAFDLLSMLTKDTDGGSAT